MRIRENIEIVLTCVGFLWLVYLVDFFLPLDLSGYGIQPRRVESLWGVLAAPLLHSGLSHLASNSIALAPLLTISLMHSRKLTFGAACFSALAGGCFVWLLGTENTTHIGASGVIFGLIGYLMALGLFRRQPAALAVSFLALFYYGWALRSLFVVMPGISWSGHFFGFLSGALFAWIMRSTPVD